MNGGYNGEVPSGNLTKLLKMVHLTIKDRDLTDLTIKNDGKW